MRSSSASAFEYDAKAAPSSTTQPTKAAVTATPPGKRAPVARPSPRMIPVCTSVVTCWCSSEPAISEPRRTGETSHRSITPRSASVMKPIPAQPLENSAVMTTIPGVRYAR